MPEYTHTLIPERFDVVPAVKQVGAFFSSLEAISAAPLQASFTVSKLTGESRTVLNPFTLQTDSFSMREMEKLKDISELVGALRGLEDYEAAMTGKGPPGLPAFRFDFNGSYHYLVRCCLRADVVSTSDWHDEVPIDRKVEYFDSGCSPEDRLGIFHNPNTLDIIAVPNAGCARFWIEFEFGSGLFPAIDDRLDVIEPRIVEVAESSFGIKFLQGCHWCA